MKTYLPKVNLDQRKWHVIDANGAVLGRLAVQVANILRGKDKPVYTAHLDAGDFVVVINAEKVKLTGNKEEKKIYQDYSGYPSGLQNRSAAVIREKNPTRIIMQAVEGMLPGNRLMRKTITRLKIYTGPNHPHTAQKVQTLQFKG